MNSGMRLRLKGFKGVKAGPSMDYTGLDEIEIDFAGIHGITTFDGECGIGKTTVMESMSHFPQLISRGGPLWQHVLLRNSEKEFESDFMGNHYRSVIKMDARSEETEGFMWVNGKPVVNGKISAYKKYVESVFGNPSTVFRSQFCPQKSKKTKDMQIENMTTGVFQSLLADFLYLQKYAIWEDTSKQCANAIMAQMNQITARIDALQKQLSARDELNTAYAQEMAAAESLENQKNSLVGNLSALKKRADELREIITANTLAQQRRADIVAQKGRGEADLAAEKVVAEAEIETLKAKYREINAEVVKVEAILREKDAVLKASEREKELQAAISTILPEIDRLNEELSKHQESVHTVDLEIQKIEASIRDLDNDQIIQTLQKELADLDRDIKDEVHALELAVNKYAAERKALDSDEGKKKIVADISDLDRTIADRQRDLVDLDNDRLLHSLDSEVKRLADRVAERGGYEFLPGQPCSSTTCISVIAATKAAEELPAAREKFRVRFDEIENTKSEMRKGIDDLTIQREQAQTLLSTRNTEIENEKARLGSEIEAKRSTSQGVTRGLSRRCDVVKANIEERGKYITSEKGRIGEEKSAKQKALATGKLTVTQKTETLSTIRKNVATQRLEISTQKTLAEKANDIQIAITRKVDLDAQLAEATTQGLAKRNAWDARESLVKATIASFTDTISEIDKSIDHEAGRKLTDYSEEIAGIEATHLPNIEKEISHAREKLATMRADLAKANEAQLELTTAQEEKANMMREISEWNYLRNTCGKDGLQATEVEGAAPLIVTDANDLLSSAYGTFYSIRLQTHDEAGKEDLRIKIITESGREVDLDDISGGQRVWNVQSLWLAMSLLSQKKSGRKFDYFCADEQDGALDTENARLFAALYDPFMKIGQFQDLFFITHKQECKAIAQNVLRFEHGKNPAWR